MKKVYNLRGYNIQYWEGEPQSLFDTVWWDGKYDFVLAHEVGHTFAGASELEAWRAAAILFGSDLLLDNWKGVYSRLLSYALNGDDNGGVDIQGIKDLLRELKAMRKRGE